MEEGRKKRIMKEGAQKYYGTLSLAETQKWRIPH